jgi:hypothetical protein
MSKYNMENLPLYLEAKKVFKKNVQHNQKEYNIFRYDKSKLTPDEYNTVGLFRSVVYQNETIVSFAPPKSIAYESFKSTAPPSITMEEYVEGTMIQLFWTGENWELATRSSVGGNVSFFNIKDNHQNVRPTFRELLLNTILYNENLHSNQLDFFSCLEKIPKHYVLSFVLQHEMNRIVRPIHEPSLYLVNVYAVEHNTIVETDISDTVRLLPDWVKRPTPYNWSLEELEGKISSQFMDYTNVGIMIYGVNPTGERIRTKLRNPSYETVRKLRGNQSKLQYRYMELCKDNLVDEYLNYYPEHTQWFQGYDKEIRKFTVQLHSFYVQCFVNKRAPLKTYSYPYRTHMYRLHEHYKETLRGKRDRVNLPVVIRYVHQLHPSILMSSINYSLGGH